ncbi:ribosome quality control complex subunit 2 [Sarocladium implicatum]|nr:ribosome quality control complex subunit 2 [Sarocladium implicatum]
MKQRFSSLDVKVIAHELQQSLVSLRLSNVYDLSSKILLLKFAKPENKKQLIIDTGFRCHLTEFARTTAAAPSAFVARLRKCLKTRRVTSVSQVGTDRILEFGFSDGQYRLFLEFFASGNIILTDADLKIMAISRTVSESEGQEPQRVGLSYSLDNRQNYKGIPPLTKERVRSALQAGVDKASANAAVSKKIKVKAGADLRRTLAISITELPPVLVENTLQEAGFETTLSLSDILADEPLLDQLVELLIKARGVVEDIISPDVCVGYIFAKKRNETTAPAAGEGAEDERNSLLYEDFHPFVPRKFAKDPDLKVIEFQGYNQMVDDFFSSLEGQKLESRLNERQAAAQRKLDAAKQDQAKRIEGLQETQTLNMRKAAAIEANSDWVQEAMDAVNGLIAQGMDWVNIEKLIEREQKRNNPVAQMIKTPLKLAENTITLLLVEEDDDDEVEDEAYETGEEDSDDETAEKQSKEKAAFKGLAIDVNLTMTPWSNAREYYSQRRVAVVKEEKTQQQAAKALKNTESKIAEDLKKGLKQEKALLQPIRKQMWYEKFIWFISSDNYLVLGGKDAQQNEMLYRRYLRKGDVYCHAELHGAASVIIKNNPQTPDAPIPPATLTQAGSLSVCSSSAWDSKAGMSAWWVNADQVSKSAPTGEFLPTGSFMVRGKKNFLPPAQLLLGLGLIFRISEESKARHIKHRLHDGMSPGTSASVSADTRDSTVDAGQATEEISDDDGGNEDIESEDEDNEAVSRENPLQSTAGNADQDSEDDTTAGVQEQMAELNVAEDNLAKPERSGESAEPSPTEELEEGEASSEDDEKAPTTGSETQNKASNDEVSQAGTASSKGPTPAKRGQKKKAKKIARKYKDQDDEDRAAAEAVIGAKAGQKRVEDEAKARADKEAELAAAKERRRAQHQRQQKEAAEHEEIRKVMMDEGVDVLEPEEAEQVTSLDALVGTPLPGDEILEVIPVCAPWNALVKSKYKVKLQPGAVKKGKAVKEILERWKAAPAKKGVVDESARDGERMWPREVELIKALKPEEIINSVPVGKLRVMTTGGTAGGSGGGKGGKGAGKGGKGGKGGKR